MTKIALISLLLLFFGMAGEVRARPLDEAPAIRSWNTRTWVELARQEARGNRAIAAQGTGFKGGDDYFKRDGVKGVRVDYQCGGEADDNHLANDCLIRVVDQANGIVCFGFAPKTGSYTQNISCVSRPNKN